MILGKNGSGTFESFFGNCFWVQIFSGSYRLFLQVTELAPSLNQEIVIIAETLVENIPLELQNDYEQNFESEERRKFVKLLGIKKTSALSHHPHFEGMIQRQNCTTIIYLSRYVADNKRDSVKAEFYFVVSIRITC